MDDRIDPPTTDSSSMGRRSKRQRKEVSSYNYNRIFSESDQYFPTSAEDALTINLPDDLLNPQAKKPKSQTSMAADSYQSRANDVVENFNGILAGMQWELQDAKKENAEMSRNIGAAEEAKRALDDEMLAATEERKKYVELAAKFVWQADQNEERYERLIAAAKGVVGSTAREFGERVGELEEALSAL